MEENGDNDSVNGTNGWQPRWGHIGVALILICLIIFSYIIYTRNNTGKVNVNCSSSLSKTACGSKSSNKSKKSGSSKATTPSQSQTVVPQPVTSIPSHSSSGSSKTKALVATGPVDDVGLFIATTVIGALGYNLYLRLKLAK